MTPFGIDWIAWLMILVLAVVEPLVGRRHLKSLRRAIDGGSTTARIGTYRRTMWTEWIGAVVFTGLWLLAGRGLDRVGFVPQEVTGQWFSLAGAAVIVAFVAIQSRRAERDPASLRNVREQLGNVDLIAPHTASELTHFKWLSLTAGVCEEVIYRGLLMGALSLTMGIWPAAVVSSLVFGIGHSYQGPTGILRTGAIGMTLATLTILTGSIYPAIVAHFLLDLVQGNMIHAAMNLPENELAAPEAA